MKLRKATYGFSLLLFTALLLAGCTARYFQNAGQPPAPAERTLQNWPYKEYWTGIVFNGAKIGFTHLSLQPANNTSGQFDVRSEAYFRFRLLMYAKSIKLTASDRIAADLTLQNFEYETHLDGNRQQLVGKRHADRLEYILISRDSRQIKSLPVKGPLYPTGCILMVPVLHGLEVGRHYRYRVFDGETRTITTVEQEILSFEQSDLFDGRAFKIKTRMQGREVTTWLDPDGRPVLEMSMGGVIISALESKLTARRYLARAALNKDEMLIAFSLIRSDKMLPHPEKVEDLTVKITAGEIDIQLINDSRQQCSTSSRSITCRIRSKKNPPGSINMETSPGSYQKYLLPLNSIPTGHPRVQALGREITADKQNTEEQVQAIMQWIKENIRQQPVDGFTAIDVLEGKKAECQGHALLYAALARSVGIPSRVVNGIIYSADFKGFLYHSWAESRVNAQWMAVDPTFHQYPADATHIKLVEGENPSDLLPLINLIGKIDVQIISAD